MWDILIHIVSSINRWAELQELNAEPIIQEMRPLILPSLGDSISDLEQDILKYISVEDRSRFIADIQAMLTRVADFIYLKFSGDEHPSEVKELKELLSMRCLLLLQFLFKNHKGNFNLESPLPLEWKAQMYPQHLPGSTPDIARKLTELNVEPKLITLLQNFLFHNPADLQPKVRSWWQLDFMLYFKRQLEYFLALPAPENATLDLLKLFILEDFNSIHVYAYFVGYFEQITLSMSTSIEQQQELLYLQKVIRQLRVDSKYAFDPGVQPLKITLINGLTAELDYLSQKEKLVTDELRPVEGSRLSKFYFEVMVTLAELMFFFRVLLDVGFIQTKFNSQLYDFIANHIRTQRAENLSKKSMRNHMSNKPYPDKIVQTTRDWLTKMINHIDMYYRN